MIKAITPTEAHTARQIFPDDIIKAWNQVIAENYRNGKSHFAQSVILHEINTHTNYSRQQVFDKGWLDVEDFYRKAGWDVTYDKASYNETGPSTFTFKKRMGTIDGY